MGDGKSMALMACASGRAAFLPGDYKSEVEY